MRRKQLLLTVPACVVALAACGSTGEVPDPGGAEDTNLPTERDDGVLDGREFVLDATTGETELIDGQDIALTFDDGVLRISEGCNGLGGDYAVVEGELLVTGSVATTEIGCSQDYLDQAEWLDDFIRSNPSTEWDEQGLTMSLNEVELIFVDRATAVPDQPLTGTTWQVETVILGSGPDSPASSIPGETSMEFAEDGTFTFRLCNSGSGQYEIEDDRIYFSDVASTLMACMDVRGDAEDVFTAMIDLEDGAGYEIVGEELRLIGPAGELALQAQGHPGTS